MNVDELRAWVAEHKAQAAALGAGTVLIALYLWHRAKVRAAASSSDQQQASATPGTAGGTVPGGGQFLVPYDGTADYSGNGTGSDGLSGPATLQGSLDALNGQLAQLNTSNAALVAALPGGTLLGGPATGLAVDNPGPTTGAATGNGGQTGATSTPGNGTTTGHPPAKKTVHKASHAPAKKKAPAPHPATHKASHPAHPAHPTHPAPAHPAHPTHPTHPAAKKPAPKPAAHPPAAAHPAPHPAAKKPAPKKPVKRK